MSESVWHRNRSTAAYEPLSEDVVVDVLVIGAGITGLTAALVLAQAGRDVRVIDANRVGAGTTGSSTGHLDTANDEGIQKLVSQFGVDAARTVMQAKASAVAQVERWVTEFDIPCGFARLPGYQYAEAEDDNYLQKEFDAAKKCGLDVSLEDAAPLPFATKRSLVYKDQGRFSPLSYVEALAARVVEASGRIHEETCAEEIEEEKGACRVETNRGTVSANDVILAGHTALTGKLTLQTRISPYQSYVIGVRVKEEVPDALYWDLACPYHYTRWVTDADPHFLIIGGADHRTGENANTQECFLELEDYARKRYTVASVEQRWSHEFFVSADGLPFIGKVPRMEHMHIGAVFSGDGLTFGTAAGHALAESLMGDTPELVKVCDPSRFPIAASAGLMTKNLMSVGKHFVGDRLASEVDTISDIPIGEGRLLREDGEMYAIFRDDENMCHVLSAVCRHMGCIVRWNSAERSWDCPCHGGRYQATGELMMGPPRHPLEKKRLR